MKFDELVKLMRENGVRRISAARQWSFSAGLESSSLVTDIYISELELFEPESPRSPRPDTIPFTPAELTALDQLSVPTEAKEEGVCVVRGCSNQNGGAMGGKICPEMCRDHALQMGGVSG